MKRVVAAFLLLTIPGIALCDALDDQFSACAAQAGLYFEAANARSYGKTEEEIVEQISKHISASAAVFGSEATNDARRQHFASQVVAFTNIRENQSKRPLDVATETLQSCMGY